VVFDGDIWRVAEVTRDGTSGGRRRAREELGVAQHVEIHKYAAQGVREEASTQQPPGVNDGVPSLSDAAGHGEASRRQAAEHVRQHVLR